MNVSKLVTNDDIAATVNGVIDDYFSRSIAEADAINPHYATLWQEMYRLIKSGGKRIRPKMTIMAYKAFGGSDVDGILPIAAAQELLHVSLLIHDDIIDRDYVRYGVNNIHAGYENIYSELIANLGDRHHYAQSAALLGGDLLISAAYRLICDSTLLPSQLLIAQRLLSQAIFEVAGGELLDIETSFRQHGQINAQTIALYKTASYTFISPLMTGAILAGASLDQQLSLRVFAESLGVAYQFTDDLIGTFGDQEITGKSTSSDIAEGKRTMMVELFYDMASDRDKQKFDKYFGKTDINNNQVAIIKDLLFASGARRQTELIIDDYTRKARQALDNIALDNRHYQILNDLITTVTRRNK